MMKRACAVQEEAWKDSGELSLEEIHKQSRGYWLSILTNHKEMALASRPSQRQKLLRSDQCSNILAAIDSLQRPIRSLYKFLDRSSLLPLSACSARYSLIKALYRMDVQLCELNILLTMYRATGISHSQETILLSQDIRQKLSEVQGSWKSMQRGIQIFWERIHALDPEISIELEEEQKIIDFQSRKSRTHTKRSQAL